MSEYKTEHLVGVARYWSLLGHLQNNPDIHTFIAVVDKETPIALVGDAMIGDDIDAFKKLMDDGKIAIVARRNDFNIATADGTVIPMTNSVECLYLPPIYLVKDRGIPHV